MENYILTSNYLRIDFKSNERNKEFDFQGYSKLSFLVPAALNGLTATFQLWDPVTSTWITTGQTQVLSTGYLVLSATQLAAIAALPIVRISLSGDPSADCALVAFRKT